MAIDVVDLFGLAQISRYWLFSSFFVFYETLAFVSIGFFKYLRNLSLYNDRFMSSTSSVTRNSYVSTRICLITPKTFFKSLA
jgi:hypothetical protein